MHNIGSVPIAWKPTVNGDSKKLAGPSEVSALKLTAGGSSAAVEIHDAGSANECNENTLRWVLDASTTDVDSQVFYSPLIFNNGVMAISRQGSDFNPVVMAAIRKYTA
jgi:hypothetical protein